MMISKKALGFATIILLSVLIVISSGCIGTKTQTETKVPKETISREALLSNIDNETQFGAIWEMTLMNATSILAKAIGKSVVTKTKVLTYRKSEGEKWESYSIIKWENGTGELYMKMEVDNKTQPYRDKRMFNFTVAKRMAYPYGELLLALSDKIKFNETTENVRCSQENCILHIVRKHGQDEFGDITGTWRVEYLEANITYNPQTLEITKASIYMVTNLGYKETLKCEFIRKDLHKLEKELEEKYHEIKEE
ncbi:hypothetical protein [Pyrococcus sp. ST04]|uniref:hypothetical protein n=1 Tax=Pyrococcus sp. ST04 TaxID=1183377 RepID=UPI0002605901|nr:hypothetical protein [Pyrococcus sp. ST04]AFK21682.1 hypothetical protein Py04_0076 [Pyrococcus sp. ST04]